MTMFPDRASSSSELPFDCDCNLPSEGLDLETKKLLIDLLDSVNGPNAITRQSRLLQKWCSRHPQQLGVKGSLRHKRVRYLVAHWKQGTNYADANQWILDTVNGSNNAASASNSTTWQEPPVKKAKSPSSKKACLEPNQCSLSSCPTSSTKKESELPTVNSPPALKKKATVKTTKTMPPATNANTMGSPLRLFGGAQSKKKGNTG